MTNTDERRMYDGLAWLWPLMGQPDEEDWIAEGEEFVRRDSRTFSHRSQDAASPGLRRRKKRLHFQEAF